MGNFRLSFNLLSVLILFVLWTPAYTDKCSLACHGSQSSATFQNGHTYNYGVDGTVSIFLTGSERQETNVKLRGQVSVTALGNCVLALKVNSLGITGADGKDNHAPHGIEKVVKFTFENGRVGPEICTEDGDHRPSVNIKRAIISLLQTEQKSSTQIDVFGSCPTDVSSSQEGSAVLLHRTRDLSRCGLREHARSDFISAVYNPNAEIKNTQILRSVLNVETKVNNGVPEKVSAVEDYLYKPFSVGENGARAEVNTKLTLTGTTKGGAGGENCVVPRSIVFEVSHAAHAEHSNAQGVLAAVKETCKTLTNGATPKSAGLFAQLVRIVRSANKEDLLKVFGQVKGHSLEKRVFLDGLLRAGTGYSIEASIHILKSKELQPLEQDLVYLTLGNARHVNNEAIKAATSLLDMKDIPKEVYLGVGALAGTYCRDHNCHKDKSDGIATLSKKFAAKLQGCKPKNKVDEDYVIAVLKGIRNIRHLEDSLIDKLIHCAADNGVKARVKASALEAFRADPCAAKIKKTALDILKNRNLDSEIRIKAYLAIIDCPCGKTANEIKNLLENEPVHQVGRFISTSLRGIRSSASPDKQLARQHYGLIGIPNRFNVDDRKYSFYREASFNIDALGVGGNVEQTVIYSQDSFLPRSASLNLTSEIFGHNVNLLEIGGRQGNLDRVIEHFLGPKSFLRTQKPQEIYDNLVQQLDNSYKKVESNLRSRRSVKSEIDNFDKQIKAEALEFNNELDLDLYLKMFGTDAIFLSLGDNKGWDSNNILDQILKYVNQGFDKVKHFQQELRAHLLFLDTEFAYPTSTGLPLKLDFVGSATGRVDVSSAVDIRQMLRNPESAKVDIKLIPSSDVELSLTMLVDADCHTTGLKIISNLHSSTGGHVIAKVIENGQGIDLQWGLPVDKQEIVTASSEMVFFTSEKGKPEKQTAIKVDNDRKDYTACFDQLSGVLGINFCGELSLPFQISGHKGQESVSKFISKYPLVGSAKVRLYLEKNDLRGYHLKAVLRSDANQGRYGIELLFDAEGSQNRRTQFTSDIVNNNEEKSIKANLNSPVKNLYGEIAYHNKARELALLVKAKIDAAEYFGTVGFNIEGNERRSVLKPKLEYQLPDTHGKQNLKVDGQLIREINGPAVRYSLQGIKIIIPNTPESMSFEGHFNKEPKAIEFDLKAQQGPQHFLISGFLKGFDVKLELQNTLNPYVNFRVNGHFENTEGMAHNDVELHYGRDFSNPQNAVVFNQLFKSHSKSPEDYNIISKNKFEIRALPLKAKLDFEVDPKKLDLEVEGLYTDRKVSVDVESRRHIKKAGDYKVKVVVSADKNTVTVFSKRDIVSPEKSNMENYIEVRNVGKYELSGVVLHKIKANDVNVGAVGHLKVEGGGRSEDIKFDIGAIENANLYSSHAHISNKGGELLDFLLKLTRGPNPNGQLKLNLKDTIAANGKYTVDNNGAGVGNIIVNFNQVQRIIKGDVKFLAKENVFNADVDLFLNFEKDNNDKVHFSTNNKRAGALTESKNKLVYSGQTTELNLQQEGVVAESGKLKSSVEVVLPTQRCLTLKVDRDITVQNNVYNGHGEVLLSDATQRGGAASIIKIQTKVANTNWATDTIDLEGQAELRLKDGKDLVSTYSFKNTPKGEKSDALYKAELSGSLIPKKAVADLSVTYGIDLPSFNDVYRCKFGYGDDLSLEITGEDDFVLPEKGDRKILSDFTVAVRLPIEKAHDIKWVTNFLYLEPENKDIELTCSQSVQVNADLYKFDVNNKFGPKAGSGKVKVVVPHVDPVVVDFDYNGHSSGEERTGVGNVKIHHGKGKTTTVYAKGFMSPQENKHKIVLNAPHLENLKSLTIDWHSKNPTPDTYNVQTSIEADGRVYKSESLVIVSKSQPLVDWKYHSPSSPKPTRLYFKASDLRPTHTQVETKIENFRDFSLDATFESEFDKDVSVKLHADSEKLGLKNYQVDIKSKDAGNGKRLEFNAVNDNKNVLSGSTSYISKQEGPKTIIEGSGTLKIKDEQKPANFKYIRTFLTEGNEQGVETFVNVAVGDRNHVAETKITNLEFKTSYVYCEEKKQCAHVELLSKLVALHAGSLQQLFKVDLDLRKLGLATEFGLQSQTDYSDKKLPQYELDIHVNRESEKIHLHAYSLPEFRKMPAGVTITLPKRVLAVESLVEFSDGKSPLPIRGEICLYPDKNKPQLKTAATFRFDVNGNERQGESIAVFTFSHPKLGKEAVFKLNGKFVRPSENTIKIETSASASHSSLGRDREAKFIFEASPVNIKLLIDTPVVRVLDIQGSATIKDSLQQGQLRFSLLQSKPVQVYAVVKDYQYYEFSTSYSDEADRKLSVIGHLQPEKRVDVSVDINLPGQKKNIAHGALFIENDLVKNDFGFSRENYLYFVNAWRKDLENLQNRIKEIGEKGSNEFKQDLKRIEPLFKQLGEAYTDEVEKLVHEITNDNSLKEISEALHKFASIMARVIEDTINALKPIVDKLVTAVSDASKRVCELYEQQVEPQVKQLYETVSRAVREYLDSVIDVAAHFSALLIDFFEKHKPELQELTHIFTQIFRDITRILVAQLKEVRARLSEVFNEVVNQVKELPLISMVKEKWQELAVPEQMFALLNDAKQPILRILPTEESRNFVEALFNYAQKKFRQEEFNEQAELKVVYEKLVSAITSVAQYVRTQLGQYGISAFPSLSWGSLFGPSPFTFPSFGGSAAVSVVSEVLRGELPNPLAYLQAYRPRSLNPLDEVPAKLRAVVVNGQHIFTFDGRHLTFPGNCRYVLVHDHVDRNFTLAIQLANGSPKALILEDKSGVIIELKENGQVTLNGASHGYPVIEKDVFAFRQPNGRLGLGSLYGLMVFCTGKLEVCYIEVNGFYLGKLRGLLGDGNNEPYDDFRLPNGKIAGSEAEFGNAYRLASSCGAVKTPEHGHHQLQQELPPACEAVFGGLSPLRPLSLLLDNKPFRQACIHAASGTGHEALEQACDLGRGYAALAVTGLLPAVLPAKCVRCTDLDTAQEVGAVYEVKLPAKQADIIVVVEVTKPNEKNYKDIVVPLVGQVVDQLKSKRITDVKLFLVGATAKYPYPILYDTDLKLKSAKVQFDDESRYDDLLEPVRVNNDYLNQLENKLVDIINTVKVSLDLLNVEAAYRSVGELQLRPGAVKHYIGVVGEHCRQRDIVLQALKSISSIAYASNNAMTVSLITDTKMKCTGKPVSQIVGFSEDSVILLGDKKAKNSENLRATLEVEPDSCIHVVENAEGVIFSASNFKENAGSQKQFLQTAATSIVNRMTQDSLVQECTCTYVDPFRVRSVCVTKDRKEAARRRK